MSGKLRRSARIKTAPAATENRGPGPSSQQIVAQARQDRDAREAGYRAKALKLYPWVCGRCAREFNRTNLRELTVHHRDHNHDNNPGDGSNWELLCVYCHDNEHSRYVDSANGSAESHSTAGVATHSPFAGLADMLEKGK
ncbi:YajD family HNH nuclease [Aestuariirhabdus sp. LZHN29]|uniref:YajD family HNH nuclease n=1 Tax=Aestuariirhabdus sp. LZHN29 TaxID=3417462 RepID=UPI003CEC68B4